MGQRRRAAVGFTGGGCAPEAAPAWAHARDGRWRQRRPGIGRGGRRV